MRHVNTSKVLSEGLARETLLKAFLYYLLALGLELCSVLGASDTQPLIPQNNWKVLGLWVGIRGQNWEVTCSRPPSESELGFAAQAWWAVEPPASIFISLPLTGQDARAQLPGT